jgi:hypothetical protein
MSAGTVIKGAIRVAVACVMVAGFARAAAAQAQSARTVRVSHHAVVMETPRGDALVLGSVEAGAVVEIVGQQDLWYEVTAPAGARWTRGWIHQRDLVGVGGPVQPLASAAPARKPAALHLRGFGEVGGTLFTAQKSFEAILGSGAGTAFGLGGQLVLPSGLFVEAGVERFAKTGSRVVVSGTDIFRLPVPETVTLMPIGATVGYRETSSHWNRIAAYVGVGAGRLSFKEESPAPAPNVSEGHIEYHVVAGAELKMAAGVWTAGEVRWRTVPDALGSAGIGASLGDSNLGGTTFVFKVLLGR